MNFLKGLSRLQSGSLFTPVVVQCKSVFESAVSVSYPTELLTSWVIVYVVLPPFGVWSFGGCLRVHHLIVPYSLNATKARGQKVDKRR